ncbi:MAG: glycosyltransferase family 2 protein [Pyrinomonadaceae bacterium]|nr:glycosyltransferase family 2 protein [Pyrinomonadaceae bacterium]
MAQIIFWTSIAVLIYTYFGYPILVFVSSRLFPKTVHRAEFEPNVTVLITAYNEERALSQKIENTLALDYPKEKLEILVASDGSTDKTDEIVRSFASKGVKLFRQEGRVGKTLTQNAAVEKANGEIIVFSDATTMYRENVLRVLMPNFADKTVGCVAGKLIYVDPNKSSVGDGARSYWNYETFIKTCESATCSLIGVSGCLYALRKQNYVPMYAEACSDFLIASKIYEQGLRTIYEPQAVSIEETNDRADREMRMRVRIITQTLTDLWRHRHLLNPLRSGFYAVELFSHKILRYSVPVFLILTFVASCVLTFDSIFFAFVVILQIAFYGCALIAWKLEKTRFASKFLSLPLYFVLANFAALMAFYEFARGNRFAAWQPIRETSNPKSQASNQTSDAKSGV